MKPLLEKNWFSKTTVNCLAVMKEINVFFFRFIDVTKSHQYDYDPLVVDDNWINSLKFHPFWTLWSLLPKCPIEEINFSMLKNFWPRNFFFRFLQMNPLRFSSLHSKAHDLDFPIDLLKLPRRKSRKTTEFQHFPIDYEP